jgi:iron complex transport system ATP-binding protein
VSALELGELSVSLDGTRIVERVSTSVEAGEWVALIGPNGAGKTTIVRAIAGLLAYQGSVAIHGEEVRTLSRREVARRAALVPQLAVVPAYTTVREYVVLGRTPFISYLGSERQPDHEAVDAALAELDLQAFAGRRLDSLSGGERQRATLARAIAQEAPLLLVDEPTASLDVGRQQHVLQLIDRLRAERGLTVFSTMHDLTLAGQYADRLLLLDRGRLVVAGTANDVLTKAHIAKHYGAEVAIIDAPGSGFVVVPVRRTMRDGLAE